MPTRDPRQLRRYLGTGDSCDGLTCRGCSLPIPPETIYITTDILDEGTGEHDWCVPCIEGVLMKAWREQAEDAANGPTG